MMTNREMIFGGAAVVAVGFAVAAFSKITRLCNKLNKSMDDIESRTSINVADEIVDDVVERVTERYFNKVVPAKVDSTLNEIKKETVKHISDELHDKVDEYGPEVEANLQKQVGQVSIEKFQEKVVETSIEKATKQIIQDLQNVKAEAIRNIKKEEDRLIRDMKDDVSSDVRDMKSGLKEHSEKAYKDATDDMVLRMKDQMGNIGTVWAALSSKMGV